MKLKVILLLIVISVLVTACTSDEEVIEEMWDQLIGLDIYSSSIDDFYEILEQYPDVTVGEFSDLNFKLNELESTLAEYNSFVCEHEYAVNYYENINVEFEEMDYSSFCYLYQLSDGTYVGYSDKYYYESGRGKFVITDLAISSLKKPSLGTFPPKEGTQFVGVILPVGTVSMDVGTSKQQWPNVTSLGPVYYNTEDASRGHIKDIEEAQVNITAVDRKKETISSQVAKLKADISNMILAESRTGASADLLIVTIGEDTGYGPAVMMAGITMVPIRYAEELGATVLWDEASQTTTYSLNDVIITVEVGNKTAMVNGVASGMPQAPYINEQDRCMVPIIMIAQELGFFVNYMGDGVTHIQ